MATEFTQEVDVNGIIWERFNAQHQADEINEIWPAADYKLNHKTEEKR
ncbi:hypothetical protein [Picosynechococcus sp. PCC 73109]|nr:hypothetical protein [Picosynechococcus sp. PCC 73109]